MELLCTESTSILSLLYFLLHFSPFHSIQLNANAWLQCCNNKTVVLQTNWFNIRTVLNPNLTLNINFDIQLQIKGILTELDITWSVQHVKGHQTGPDLSWDVQLNNKADALATKDVGSCA
eukprot:12595037-Ditylum_brightwellii.AAC.1